MSILRKENAARFPKGCAHVRPNRRSVFFLDLNRSENEHGRFHLLDEAQRNQRKIDKFDSDEGRNQTAHAVDEKISNQDLGGAN